MHFQKHKSYMLQQIEQEEITNYHGNHLCQLAFKATRCVGVWEGCANKSCLGENSAVKNNLTTTNHLCTKRLGKSCNASFLKDKAARSWRDGSVAQVLAALPEDQDLVPHTHTVV